MRDASAEDLQAHLDHQRATGELSQEDFAELQAYVTSRVEALKAAGGQKLDSVERETFGYPNTVEGEGEAEAPAEEAPAEEPPAEAAPAEETEAK
jgi:hypothetical protein